MTASEVIFSMCGTSVQAIPGERNLFDTTTRTIHLSNDVIHACTSKAMAIVAHECAHSQQPIKAYQVTMMLIGVALSATVFSALLLSLPVMTMVYLILSLLVSAKLIVLYFEFDASWRAYRWLKQSGRVNLRVVRKVLTESFITYLNIRWKR